MLIVKWFGEYSSWTFICHVDHTNSRHILIFILFSIFFHINILLARDKCRRMIRGIIYMQTRIKQLQKRPFKLCIHWIRIHLFPILCFSLKFQVFNIYFRVYLCCDLCVSTLAEKCLCIEKECTELMFHATADCNKNMNYLHQVSVYVMTKSAFCLFGCSYTTQQLNNS